MKTEISFQSALPSAVEMREIHRKAQEIRASHLRAIVGRIIGTSRRSA